MLCSCLFAMFLLHFGITVELTMFLLCYRYVISVFSPCSYILLTMFVLFNMCFLRSLFVLAVFFLTVCFLSTMSFPTMLILLCSYHVLAVCFRYIYILLPGMFLLCSCYSYFHCVYHACAYCVSSLVFYSLLAFHVLSVYLSFRAMFVHFVLLVTMCMRCCVLSAYYGNPCLLCSCCVHAMFVFTNLCYNVLSVFFNVGSFVLCSYQFCTCPYCVLSGNVSFLLCTSKLCSS
jgi:hypothetical protein